MIKTFIPGESMEKNLYGYLADLDRIMWSDISREDQRRELDHFFYSIEGIIRNKRILSLDETRRIFYAAQTVIDSDNWRFLTRALIIEGLTLRRMTKNPLVKEGQLVSLSGLLNGSVQLLKGFPPDRWSGTALIEAGKAFEKAAAKSERNTNLKRAGRSYSNALGIGREYQDHEMNSILEERIKKVRKKLQDRT